MVEKFLEKWVRYGFLRLYIFVVDILRQMYKSVFSVGITFQLWLLYGYRKQKYFKNVPFSCKVQGGKCHWLMFCILRNAIGDERTKKKRRDAKNVLTGMHF